MSDDLFSQLFNLFNNDDGDVNWQLAEQINNHINKDTEEDRLLSNSDLNYQEIFRVIELSLESSTKIWSFTISFKKRNHGVVLVKIYPE